MSNNKSILIVFAFLIYLLCFPVYGQQLKVMSYNIHHGADADEASTLKKIGHYIEISGADLVGLQEVDSVCNRSGKIDQMRVLADITGMYFTFYRHFAYDGGAYGLGILSKYPIQKIDRKRITSIQKGKKNSLAFLSVDVLKNHKRLTFATVHMSLDQETRIIQANEIKNYISGAENIIITGDFNALPDTKEVQIISEKLTSLDEELTNTFPSSNPIKKIDYIFASPGLRTKNSKTVVQDMIKYSDHLPLEGHF